MLRALLVLLALAVAAVADARNVLLIIADDQGRDLAVYGNPVLRTANLDRLAARGTLFTNAFATVSSCSPSRSVIYTGLYSHSNGMYGLAHDVHNQHLLPSVRTLPQLLSAAGYRTALVGKKHILPDDALPFDEELAPERPGNRDVAFMAAQARKFIAKNSDRPFLVVVGYSDPHRAPENFGNTRVWPEVTRESYDPAKVIVPAHLPGLPEVRRDLADYYESISRLDSGVGLLLDALRETAHGDDTLVIYMSDNGRPFPGAKTTLYDDGIHLPLIVASPAQGKRGVRNGAMVSWVDIMPTIGRACRRRRRNDSRAGRSCRSSSNPLRKAGIACSLRMDSMKSTSTTRCERYARVSTSTSSIWPHRWSFRSLATSRLRRRGGQSRHGPASASARAPWMRFCIVLARNSTICGRTLRRCTTLQQTRRIARCWNACAQRWRSSAPTRAIHGFRGKAPCSGTKKGTRPCRLVAANARFIAP
jgi:hypothetical protein